MLRGTTARIVLSVLAAALLALPLFAPVPSFASAHTAHHIGAEADPGTTPSGQAPRDETAACRDTGPAGGPAGLPRTRERPRTADHAPTASARPLPDRNPPTASEPVRPGAPPPAAGPSAAHTPAALQVFRC
ncbi:hypothetical protein ACIF8T_14870 [Streptomyces sp. NPDC085946]|uniref:hypothetical protein n=1 Tax=Streptomyces sp. NPDC085946 TaxID=3365744 RepID=UPI0037CF444D